MCPDLLMLRLICCRQPLSWLLVSLLWWWLLLRWWWWWWWRHFLAQETQTGSHKHLKQLSLAILCDDQGRSSTTWSMRPEWCHTRSDLSGRHIIRACGLWGYHATGTWGMCRLQNPKRHYFLGQVGFSPFTGHGLVPVFALVLSRFCVSSSPTSNGGWPCRGTNHPVQLWQCVWITTFLPQILQTALHRQLLLCSYT